MKTIIQEQILSKPPQLSVYFLFLLLIIAWGFSWLVIKTSISYCPRFCFNFRRSYLCSISEKKYSSRVERGI